MKTIEERARKYDNLVSSMAMSAKKGYFDGATEQCKIDHSKEHVIWLIKQYHDWEYEKGHDMNTESWEEWISKAMEE